MTITLDDVELAIKILEEFMREYQKAQRIMRRFNTFMRHTSGRLEERIAEMILRQQQQPMVEEELDTGLTEEEIKRIDELKKKLLGSKQ